MASRQRPSIGATPARIPLPVLGNGTNHDLTGGNRARRFSRWRTTSLIGVHLLIAGHIAHWQVTGRTLGSVQLSDAMHTLELGEVNPGFLLFAAALVLTAVLGRFFCGWACHMGALQDFCGWMLKKAGIRPTPLRSRLLGYIPVALGLYMFIWPTFKRVALLPLLQDHWPWAARQLKPVVDFPGLTLQLATENLLDRLPGPLIAIPFLLVCGVATVYFLGARGLCRYGCPYGGLLTPMSRLAPGSVVVDASRCDGCGRCTAACSQHVRVLEETRAYGAVLDSACVRSLDCVAACPHDALSIRFGAPPVVRAARCSGPAGGPAPLPWRDDLMLAGMFLLSFLVFRGLYGVIPMLMAVGMSLCTAGLFWQAVRLRRASNVAFRGFTFRRHGQIRPAGVAFACICALSMTLFAQAVAVRVILWRASAIDQRVTVSREAAMLRQVPDDQRATALRALRLYRLGSSVQSGGIGMADTTWAPMREAWLHVVAGDFESAERSIGTHMRVTGSTDAPTVELAAISLARNDARRAMDVLVNEVERGRRPAPRSTRMLAQLRAAEGDAAQAEAVLRRAVLRWPDDAETRATLGEFLLAVSRPAEAYGELVRAAALSPRSAHIARLMAQVCYARDDLAAALDGLHRAARLDPRNAYHDSALGAAWLTAAGGAADTAEAWRKAAEAGLAPPEPPGGTLFAF